MYNASYVSRAVENLVFSQNVHGGGGGVKLETKVLTDI